MQNTTSNQQAILANVFQFSQSDIDANLQGRLSQAQRERITSRHYANCRATWILFRLIFGVGFLGFLAEMARLEMIGITPLLIYLSLTIFFALIVRAFILYYRQQMNRTLRQGKVQRVEGSIRLMTKRGEKLPVRYFCVATHQYVIDSHQHFILLQQSGLVGRQAAMYVLAPYPNVLSVILQGNPLSDFAD